ncbi:hypothetical protein BDD12DRAFT_536378 [Trichophaea hybrida]|nr:hypothetical protein BDD12DRAFT_536378 [Trichophaea hybrida]
MPNPNPPPSHNPLVPQLTGPNYATWKTKMEMHLTHLNLWALVLQRRPRPDITNTHSLTASDDAQQWDSDAALATATISLHLSTAAKRHTSHIANPVTLWKTLQDTYEPKTFPARFHHWQNLSTLRLSSFKTRDGGNAMDQYLDAFHAHMQQLRCAGVWSMGRWRFRCC